MQGGSKLIERHAKTHVLQELELICVTIPSPCLCKLELQLVH